MENIYSIFRELNIPDELTNIILFKYKGIQHPNSILINNKINMIFIRKSFYCLDYISSYMWGLNRSLNIINSLFCYDSNKFLIDIGRIEGMKEPRRLFNNNIYMNNTFKYSYVYYLNKLTIENNYTHKSICSPTL
jgi:hypothetical protein